MQELEGEKKILIMTGNKLRHLFFAASILKKYSNARLLVESQPNSTWGAHLESPTPILKNHFQNFSIQEKKWFEEKVKFSTNLLKDRNDLNVEYGQINEISIQKKIENINPKLIVVFSTSILKEDFINKFKGNIINIHAGLSPYYRGSGTNVFPFYNKELEFVGMTVHHISSGIDSGDIVVQGRPKWDREDTTHTIGCKNIILAVDLVSKTIDYFFQNGKLTKGKAQDLSRGHLYYKKDFTDEVVIKVNKNISDGMVEKYASNPPPIVDIVESTHE